MISLLMKIVAKMRALEEAKIVEKIGEDVDESQSFDFYYEAKVGYGSLVAPAGKSLETVLEHTRKLGRNVCRRAGRLDDEETAKYSKNTKKMMTVRYGAT